MHGARSWPRATVQLSRVSGQAQLAAWETPALAHAPCSVPNAVPFFWGTVPQGAGEKAAPWLLEGPPLPILWGPCPVFVHINGGDRHWSPPSPSFPASHPKPFWRCSVPHIPVSLWEHGKVLRVGQGTSHRLWVLCLCQLAGSPEEVAKSWGARGQHVEVSGELRRSF